MNENNAFISDYGTKETLWEGYILSGRCRSSPISVHPSANGATAMTEWLTAAEAAAHLKVRPRTLLLWVRQGRVPAHGCPASGAVSGDSYAPNWMLCLPCHPLALLRRKHVKSAATHTWICAFR
jgi:hypothetical protein